MVYTYEASRTRGVIDLDKEKLLTDICEFYNYELTISEDSVKVSCPVKVMVYSDIEEALKDWVTTMETSNKDIYESGEGYVLYNTWGKAEIEFIKGL